MNETLQTSTEQDSLVENRNKAEVMAYAENPHREAAIEIGAVATEVGPEALLAASKVDIVDFSSHVVAEQAGKAYDQRHPAGKS